VTQIGRFNVVLTLDLTWTIALERVYPEKIDIRVAIEQLSLQRGTGGFGKSDVKKYLIHCLPP
jgi:hypothetical protein